MEFLKHINSPLVNTKIYENITYECNNVINFIELFNLFNGGVNMTVKQLIV